MKTLQNSVLAICEILWWVSIYKGDLYLASNVTLQIYLGNTPGLVKLRKTNLMTKQDVWRGR